ncbi:recombinase family protein [Streptomyces sp. NPDC058371]|uniref:recombinase family protein n=1 Tax=Streptomyces sp. NPDC058371 TaxID=3346463 RepID=UPI0036624AA5
MVGVAGGLNVSATKVPLWKRQEFGDWLNNRVPEFDVLLFWKLDRFIRRLPDLSTMIDWCLRYGENLISKNGSIDLTTPAGRSWSRSLAASPKSGVREPSGSAEPTQEG